MQKQLKRNSHDYEHLKTRADAGFIAWEEKLAWHFEW